MAAQEGAKVAPGSVYVQTPVVRWRQAVYVCMTIDSAHTRLSAQQSADATGAPKKVQRWLHAVYACM